MLDTTVRADGRRSELPARERHDEVQAPLRRRRRAASGCSSAPTSTCRRTTPATSPTTRASARRCPRIRDALARGAAVMVTSHLGRPTEGEWKAEDSLAPIAQRLSELLGAPVPLIRDWVDGGAWHAALQARAGRAARELPLQQGREEERRRARAEDGEALRRLRATTRSAPRTAPRRRRTASRSSRRSPAPARCSRPSSTRSARRSPHPARPLVAIVAGSKVSTKLTILRALAAKVDALIVGGGIANTFILAARRHDRQVARRAGPRRRGARRSSTTSPARCRSRSTRSSRRNSRPTRRRNSRRSRTSSPTT